MALLFESVSINVFAIFATFSAILYLYFTRHFSYWKKKGVPYEKPLPFFGNLKDVVLQRVNVGILLRDIYNRHKDKPYVGFFSFDRPALLVNDLDLVKNIIIRDSQNFIDHNIGVEDDVDPIFGKMIMSLRGQRWKHMRVNLTPIFTRSRMKVMLCLMKDCGRELTLHLDRATANDPIIDVKEVTARYTTDVISSCAFGIETNSLRNPNAEIRQRVRKFFEYSALKGAAALFLFFAPKLQNFFRLKFVDDESADFLRRTVWDTVHYREKHGFVRKDFMDSMMELRKKTEHNGVKGQEDNGDELSQFKIDGDDVVAQAFAFFAAGYETSASTMTFALYELSFKPEMQRRLRTEFTEVLANHSQELTYDAIQEMTYLDMVVSETMRKYPILGFLDRVCLRDYQLPGPNGKGNFTLPAGTGVYIPLLGIHSNPEFYPDPEKFDPERFTEEEKITRHTCLYMPFGEGPRICIGKRFGLMQVKTGLIHILLHYEVSPCNSAPLPIVFDPRAFTMQNLTNIPLTLKKVVV